MLHEELLKEEYLHLQKIVEEFDGKTITIKAWSVTGSLVAIGTGFSNNVHFGNALFLIGALSSFLFWIVEANWKAYQLSYYQRITRIETHFRGGDYTSAFQISCTWAESWHNEFKKRRIEIMFWPGVMLPHAVIVVGGIILFFVI
ncbi:hypothetical protein [Olivibacter jilunii]|uniref:hypothetical protein n=1 Tax=Olivibacter jilunii TaxID=985016 RepID=UPI0010318E78|nr:hypothetical protein [Olivibacter jilunii]